jgi:hypothetical protein
MDDGNDQVNAEDTAVVIKNLRFQMIGDKSTYPGLTVIAKT